MKPVFACELCGATFDTSDAAAKCEQSHVHFGPVVKLRYSEKRPLPDWVTFLMSDGYEAHYSLDRIGNEKRFSKPKVVIVEPAVDPTHQTDHCDYCGAVAAGLPEGESLVRTSNYSGAISLCPRCYGKAGNTVR